MKTHLNIKGNSVITKFAQCIVIYCMAGAWAEHPSLAAAVSKCAPIICLALGAAGHRSEAARSVATGLALSALADAFLVWPGTFALLFGILFFAAAHIFYIKAFGWRPLSPKLGILAYTSGIVYVLALYLWSPPPPVLQLPVVVYAALLATCAWRAGARGGLAAGGAVLFVISDAMLGFSLFGGSLPYKQVLVMSTYYAGQLGITLSIFTHSP